MVDPLLPALKLVKLVVNSFLAIGAAWASRKAAGETVFQESYCNPNDVIDEQYLRRHVSDMTNSTHAGSARSNEDNENGNLAAIIA